MKIMGSDKVKIAVGFVVISLIWGSTWLAIKIGLESVPPFFGVAIRFAVASMILAMIVVIRRESVPLTKEALILYTSLAVLSFSFPYALVYWSEQYISSGLASVLFSAYPFVVAITSHFFLRAERLTLFKVIGIGLGFIGVLVIFWSDISMGNSAVSGMVGILLSTVLQGVSLVIVKRMNKSISPTVLSFGGMVIGVLILFAIALLFEDISTISFDSKGITSILYLGTLGTVVTFVIYYWLLKHVEAVYLSLVSFVTPVLALVLGSLLLGESFSSRVIVGAGFILAGIIITNGRDFLSSMKKGRPVPS
jgi:drug/metabolite transporter (DMT)-like permease